MENLHIMIYRAYARSIPSSNHRGGTATLFFTYLTRINDTFTGNVDISSGAARKGAPAAVFPLRPRRVTIML
jgi:hypothetical protein